MFENSYIVALYGWVFFNIITLGFAKDKKDSEKKYFNYRVWFKYHWDNMIVTLFAIPIMVEFSTDLWTLIVNDWFNKDWEYNRLSLMAAVHFVQLIYYIIIKLKK